MKFLKYILILGSFCCASLSDGQDIHFAQFTYGPLLLNPGTAGVFYGAQRVYLNYRMQWVGIGAKYRTIGASLDMPVLKPSRGNAAFMGLGLNFFSDKAGDSDFGLTKFSLSTSGVVPLNDYNKVSVGMQAGIAQRSVNMDALKWGNQYNGSSYDPSILSQEYNSQQSFVHADFATGVYYQFLNNDGNFTDEDIFMIDGGVAIFHFNKPAYHFFSEQDERILPRWTGFMDLHYDFPGSGWGVLPAFVMHLQGTNRETTTGVLLRKRLNGGTHKTGLRTECALSFGAYYRLSDALIPQIQVELGEFALGISYDINTSSLSEVTNYQGGYELSLRYRNFNEPMFRRH